MAQEKGVNISRHEMRTTDGYWLTLHRVGVGEGHPCAAGTRTAGLLGPVVTAGPSESYGESPKIPR
ncbi:hypothetical protein J6590_100354 [Homalodisca vitripennis]|nr:hypothetical protein J6590_100354 [Homalodisca vitripennis]